jgi:hypothetical protein
VSRQAIEGSAEQFRQSRDRRWDEAELLVLYIEGQRFGHPHVISAVGNDRDGGKHVLGIRCEATENAAAAKDPLTRVHENALAPDHKHLFAWRLSDADGGVKRLGTVAALP